jgi:hypothetical protein
VKNADGTNSLTVKDHYLKPDFGNNTELIKLNLDKMYEENDNGKFIKMFIKLYDEQVSLRRTRKEFLFLE